eukprot:gnl/Spiro4/9535_TR5053_c0_g1_i1.p1 gnl/Spiro4/9535_TR5053_c0_g1~~gnl/Spiro4/9535_TR5053_c0_g1_i1.p1  ORF type:complete len:661 (+),score=227.32 gnl/Spiro4/9535_TR5053_c0_g1_i1:34-1983(+)
MGRGGGSTHDNNAYQSVQPEPAGAPPTTEFTGVFSRAELWLIFISCFLALFMAALDQTVISVALPKIVLDFGDFDLFAWVIAAYLLTMSSFMPIFGKFSDIFGRRLAFQIGMATFIVASALGGASKNMPWLIGARAVQGIGGSGLLSLTTIIVGDIVSPRERGMWQSFLGIGYALGTVAGPLIGGFFVDHISWRWIFWMNVPIGIVSMVITHFFMRIPLPPEARALSVGARLRQLDYFGTVLVITGTSFFVVAITWGGNKYAWGSPMIIGCSCGAVVFFSLFILNEYIVGRYFGSQAHAHTSAVAPADGLPVSSLSAKAHAHTSAVAPADGLPVSSLSAKAHAPLTEGSPFLGDNETAAAAAAKKALVFCPEAIMPLHLFRNRDWIVSTMIQFFVSLGLFGVIGYLPVYFQVVIGDDGTSTGLRVLPLMVSMMITMALAGELMSRCAAYRWSPLVGSAILASGVVMISFVDANTNYWSWIVPGLCLVGAGNGLIFIVTLTLIQSCVTEVDMAAATGSASFIRELGASIGIAVYGSLLNNKLETNLRDQFGYYDPRMPDFSHDYVESLGPVFAGKFWQAYTDSLDFMFRCGIPFVGMVLLFALLIRRIQLNDETNVQVREKKAANAHQLSSPTDEVPYAEQEQHHGEALA